jgi:predicted peroxiredoxin
VSRRGFKRRSLAIVEVAFRGTVEEQYGHIVWLSRVIRKMGAEHSLLLQGDAVLYAVACQPTLKLDFGPSCVEHLSHYENTMRDILREGVSVYVRTSDCKRLGISSEKLIDGVRGVEAFELPGIFETHDCIWYW